ncbi:MAG TPA: glycosyltransferase family 4 protein [Bacteroidales bacterium]|nr:glycosyltransferase family 4 protein [Bacteroidales bacterium]
MTILMLLENDYLSDFRVQKEVYSLHEAGHKLIVAAVTAEDAPYKVEREDCILFRKKMPSIIRKASVGALKFPFYFNFWMSYINSVMKVHKANVVHVHDLPLARVGFMIKEQYNAGLVLDLHENWPDFLDVSQHTKSLAGRLLSSTSQWRRYEKESVSQADKVITVVAEMKERLIRIGAVPDKIIILENTPLVSTVTGSFPGKSEIFKLIYVGGITRHRGLQYVIKGLSLLGSRLAWHLTIAGDGRYVKELKILTDELGLNSQVSFRGKVAKHEAESLISQSDLAVLPHVRSVQSDNSSPNKLFEYMAAGIPVLASNCISIKRVIDDTDSGISYVYDSPEDFSVRFMEVYQNRSLLHSKGENGRNAVKNLYNWEVSVSGLIEMYRTIAGPDYKKSI